ncbi:hypothetical protein NFI96_031681, partial [Prochilodus magdalenae]
SEDIFVRLRRGSMASNRALPLTSNRINSDLCKLQETYDVCVRCSRCCKGKTNISYDLVALAHQCPRNILLARQKGNNSKWRLVTQRPKFPQPSSYKVCWYFSEGKGCTLHGDRCAYARSSEEAAVWNFMMKAQLEFTQLIKLLPNGSTFPTHQENQAPAPGCVEVVQEILSKFQGTFVELCKNCFHDSPRKITLREQGTPCTGHSWSPILVFCQKGDQKTVVYDEIRPLPNCNFQQWNYCRYVENGEPCWHGADRCWFAHSHIEMAVWKLESTGSLDRSHLLHASQRRQSQSSGASSRSASRERERQHYCHVCKCQFPSNEEFMNHCFSVKHKKLIFGDSSYTWKFREPPLEGKVFKLCERSTTCEYGDSCMDAHSVEELQEWRCRHKAVRRKARAAEEQGLLSYQDSLLEEYRRSSNKEAIMKETLPDVSVSCDTGLIIFVRQENISHRWKFTVKSKVDLEAVALMKQDVGATFALGEDSHEKRSYSSGDWFNTDDESNTQKVYEITVSFTSDHPGFYEQWLVLDFDMRPVLLQKLKVTVGEQPPERVQDNDRYQQSIDSAYSATETESVRYTEQVWQEGTVEMVPYFEMTEAERQLLNRYRQTNRHLSTETTEPGSITRQNYKKKMHHFLYQEEMEQEKLIRRLNLRGKMSLKNYLFEPWCGAKYAIAGKLFGSVSVSHSLTPDTPEGYMLKRGVKSVLVGLPNTEGGLRRIYEAEILKDTVGETQVYVQLSSRCCTELNLKSDQTVEMEIQFQLDRKWFCEMHKAVDILPDLQRVLPDLSDNSGPVRMNSSPGELNEKQQTAMDFVLASDHRNSLAPLLIYGPFGTGKTFTLVKITLALALKPQNKILICTHTNSSADLYVKDHFHSSVTANHSPRPLRIKESGGEKTDPVTLQYCHVSKNGSCFEFPDRETLDVTKIIITTTGVARFFHDMQLPSDYFSHIFIDEASQMLECEALMALGLAGKKTQVVLAGDHMQMGPKLFSVGEDKRSDHTLLNRLFHYYQTKNTTTATNSRIIFNENYRSTPAIVEFVSTHFYVGKSDAIKAKGNVPPHPNQNALLFFYVRGECLLDITNLSWFNPAQIECVVAVVYEVLSGWPEEWQPYDPASICVLSHGSQVFEIRKRLKQQDLGMITVENAANVQGKQFRVIIITTVHTKDTLKVTEQPCLEFFNDMRVLNTAMTRAQSQVIVVGDATALCCSQFGKCWRLWRSYIKHCIGKESFYPQDFTLDSLDQELLELSNMIKTEEDDSSDDDSVTSEIPDITEDPILKELLNEDNDLQIQLTEEGLFPVLQADNLDNNLVRHVRKESPTPPNWMLQDNSNNYEHGLVCELVLERYDSGYAKPLEDPSIKIHIKGRNNLGQAVSGDEVTVDLLTPETSPPKGKVIKVLKHSALSKEFVCTIDNNDKQLMTPINICFPKLFTPFWKDKPYHIAVRNSTDWSVERFIKINEEARRNNLFVVRFLKWRKDCKYPLGIVVQVLPRVTSLEDGMKVLEKEYQLKRTVSPPVHEEMQKIKKIPLFTEDRQDFRKLLTFTIDASTSQDLDDAISVRDLGQCYEIGIHIADVASFVAKDSELDKYARQQGTSFYISEGEPTHMFPNELSTKDFSLLPGCERRCISLLTKVDKQTHRIQRRSFFKSVICSNRRFSYEETEEILRTSGDGNDFHTLEGCLAVACHFAEIHRKDRKQDDWCYKSPDEDTVLGKRRSHRLVEELMIMFNHTVADRLLSDKTRSLTPLRCQDRPNREELRDFVDKNASLLPMSIHLSSQLDHVSESLMQQNDHPESFPILASVLNSLKIAAQDEDIHSIVDLITTDDIHPLLLPLILSMRKHLNKSLVLRANSAHLARIGHYDLVLDSYTWASSPIRRYVDVIVQRLLHSVLDNTNTEYTQHDIDLCCVDFTQKNTNQSSCQKKSDQLSLASKLSCQNARKVAYIVEANPTGNNFRISFPLNSSALPGTVGIMYRDLQLVDQPCFNEEDDCMVLRWKRRVYSVSNPRIHADLKLQKGNAVITHVPTESWKNLVSAIREEKWQYMVQVIEQMNSVHTRQASRRNMQIPPTASKMEIPNQIEEHYLDMSMKLKQGQNIEVQLGTDTVRGLLVPAVQLLVLNPKFEICLDHTKNPIVCFSKYALCSSRTSYPTYMDYQKIWKPLCEIESACSAVAENESIVIKDAELKWKQSKEHLEGSFQLPLEKKDQWAIDADLGNCFLCIRLRIQQKDLSPILVDSLSESQNFNLMDVPGLIWIAHGVVTSATKELKYIEIDFRINHMPMANIPDQIFHRSARFTVELIPKLLPDVRKENAVENLTKANQLVKAIATGKKTRDQRTTIPTCNRSRFEIENHLSFGFPHLNNSQSKAIKEALNNEFTLIQGPPGTGKTVVGVHIVYWFFQENQKRPNLQRVENEDKKKSCILYCGPSNKSVDVVAGQLLKLRSKLKPLRVYSDQMEILEFPYPGSSLKLSRHSQRIERPNEELRSITLHHRIRSPENPFSAQIRAFDLKIQRLQRLTDEELKSYKDCLNEARKYELLQHDVILCTCTTSPHPLLVKVLNFIRSSLMSVPWQPSLRPSFPWSHTNRNSICKLNLILADWLEYENQYIRIVLLGDHKQLQPVVNNDLLQRLGMKKSLFERYMRKSLLLDTQYRMQEDICAFPSKEFYEGRLKTIKPHKPKVFMTEFHYPTSIIFGHVEVKELSLVVSTERGNENSKANVEEAEEAVRIARLLMNAGIAAKDIAILTPYNAQVAKINEILYTYSRQNITVNTIMKSQGSEWRYVILSTVRSCPGLDIEMQPTRSWLLKSLGFIMDPNQVNVGITRAQEGLCIIGNRDLLYCSPLWRRLLWHYKEKHCLVDSARDIRVARA